MGGMQSLAAAALYPDRVKRVVSISAAAKSHPYSIALRHTQRQVLMFDPMWNKGEYYEFQPPQVGMKLARQIATISYRSGPEWEKRFGRRRSNEDAPIGICPDFLIETYLDRQGERWCDVYDANSFIYISKAMDLFDISESNLLSYHRTRQALAHKHNLSEDASLPQITPQSSTVHEKESSQDLVAGLSRIQQPTLVLGVRSDILFPHWQQAEIADGLRDGGNNRVTYYELTGSYGHDTFLIDLVNVGAAVKGHLEHRVA
jgi:homoserine O-acetyltransferase